MMIPIGSSKSDNPTALEISTFHDRKLHKGSELGPRVSCYPLL